jgi:hypothetical protein
MTLSDLKVYLNPKFWVMIYPYDKECDDQLKDALENDTFHKAIDPHYSYPHDPKCMVSIEGIVYWVGNYPYGVFSKVVFNEYSWYVDPVRPSRVTIAKAWKNLQETDLV